MHSTRLARSVCLALLAYAFTPSAAAADDLDLDEDLKRDQENSEQASKERYVPPEPKATDQEPRPYLPQRKAGQHDTPSPILAEVDVLLGTTLYSSSEESANVDYSAGFTRGVALRVKPLAWLGMKARCSLDTLTANIGDGGLGLAGTRYDELELKVVDFRFLLEPELMLTERFKAFVGVGIALQHFRSKELISSGATSFALYPRTGSGIELPLELGFGFEIVPRLLSLGVVGTVSLLGSQSGDLFDTSTGSYDSESGQQVVDNNSRIREVGALPSFAPRIEALAMFGVLL